MDDLAPTNLRQGEHTFLDRLSGDLGSARANWQRNSSVLREEMRRGVPIHDASAHLPDSYVLPDGRTVRQTFLRMERNILRNRGWTFDGEFWNPPINQKCNKLSEQPDFSQHVEREFAFLIEEFGFQFSGREQFGDNLSSEYRSPIVFVRCLKSAPEFETQFVFGRIGIDDAPNATGFDWTDVAGLECCRDWNWQHNEGEAFAGRMKQLARLLRDCGARALRGEKGVYIEMLNMREQLREKHINEERCNLIRSRAGAAWEERDYEKVVEL